MATNAVLDLTFNRIRRGSRLGERDDGRVLAVVFEGGAMRGAVSAGMGVALEAAGLLPAFDRVYGTSAGALNGAAFAAGQAALSSTHYLDAVIRRVIDPRRLLRRGPAIDYDLLFGDVIALRKPLSWDSFSAGPEFRAIGTSMESGAHRVLADFLDLDELMLAVRASATVPMMCGPLPSFRGEPIADGGLIDPIPYATALREGATDVLVLRSRSAGYRKARPNDVAERMILRLREPLRSLLRAQPSVYNRQAAELENAGPEVAQITVPDGIRLIGRFENNRRRVAEALELGAAAMAAGGAFSAPQVVRSG